MGTAFWFVLTATLQVTLLSIVALVAQRFFYRNRPKAASRLLAFSSLLVLLLSAAILMPLPSWFSRDFSFADSSNSAAGDVTLSVEKSQPESGVPEFAPASEVVTGSSEAVRLSLPAATWAERFQNFSEQIDSTGSAGNQFSSLGLAKVIRGLGVAIVVIFAIGLVRFAVGLIALGRLKAGSQKVTSASLLQLADSLRIEIGCKRRIELYRVKGLTTAATVGSITPHIFLSADFQDWDLADQKSVMAHEIAHIHHRDFEANVVSQICRVVHFFNPVVRWMTSQMRLQQELAADRVAARVTSGATEYTRTLASLALRQDDLNHPVVSMFLPQKDDFIQRIKMLQQQHSAHSPSAGWMIPVLTLGLAVAICGIRLPTTTLAEPVAVQADEVTGFDLSWVSKDAAVTCLRPSRLMKAAMIEEPVEKVKYWQREVQSYNKSLEEHTRLGIEHIDEVITCVEGSRFYQIYRTFEDNLENFKSLGELVGPEDEFPIQIKRKRNGLSNGLILDDRSILWAYDQETIEQVKDRGKAKPTNARWFKEFRKAEKKPVVMTIDGSGLNELLQGMTILTDRSRDAIRICESVVISIDVQRKADLVIVLEYGFVADAQTVEKMMPEVQKELSRQFASMANAGARYNQIIGQAILDSIESAKVKRDGKRLEITTSFKPDMTALTGLADEIDAAHLRGHGLNNMRQLGLALLNYESAYGEFPAATMRHESGHEYSWRIAILPFLEEGEMYERYRFDEPWNSEHNREVTSEMPEYFKHPSNESATGTNYFAITGPGTMFPPGGGLKFTDITDGTSRTVLLVESNRDSHWAKPGGIPLAEALNPTKLGGFTEGVIHMNMSDGSSRSVSNQITPAMLAALFSTAGGQDDIILADLALKFEPVEKEKPSTAK
ncbi:M56 family metallopeptidase [Mariniblastus fucicola]|uniref:Regulatory protein BlaR1 n=1 Tax=Mariniblastus fucicola TaxID=980251 RepID=A0A5B9PIN0_9BACT|nr:M56 family metallopeptidase [Mariniblastus fucicola]QEG24522.1 Regulatory protein BlaR1 [Mariniblastus fucicola]